MDGIEMGDRKGGDIALEAFRKLNLPDARLILKATGRSAYTGLTGDPRVTLLTGKLDIWQYQALMQIADCFVYPSHGEGFGLQPLEAMATGLPCIVTDYSGMSDFLDERWALPLPARGEEVAANFTRQYGRDAGNPDYECVWARIAVDDVCDRMLWCYERRDEAAELGRRAAEMVAAEWTWDQAGVRGLAKINHFLGRE
jgi:glycosyltransferase involved in cell wall biosynthesis